MEDKDPHGADEVFYRYHESEPVPIHDKAYAEWIQRSVDENKLVDKPLGRIGKIVAAIIVITFVCLVIALGLGLLDYIITSHFWFWR